MRVMVVLLSLWSAIALAQSGREPQPPGPQPPPSPPPPEEPSADTLPTGETSDTNPAGAEPEQQPAPKRVSRAWGPLDYTGWPYGFSVEDLRGLPECGPEGLPPMPGVQITCRPPMAAAAMSWSIGVDYTTGATFGTVATTGGAHGFGVDTHIAPSRYLQLGLRYEFLGISVPRSPGVGSHAALSQHVLASVRLRLWTDETGRNAWTLGGGGGLAIRGDELGGVAPMVRASLAREVGLYYRHNASLAVLELAYEQSFGDTQVQAILASLRTGAEVNVITPKNLGTPATPSSHITSLHMLLSAWWGLGMSVGVPVVSNLRWETSGDFLTNVTKHHPVFRGYDGAQWSARTGVRAGFGIMYALAQGGVSWFAHDPRGELHRVVHGEFGFDMNLMNVGAWLRWDVDDGFDSAGLIVKFMFGGGRWGAKTPTLRLPSINMPDVGTSVGGGVDANVNVNVDVNVEPVVIEVPLGVSLFGLGVHIDPRILPIDQLSRAGFVHVELTGPASELSSFKAQLSGTLDSRGVHVDGWSTVETGAHVVRARFTIWPPGTRPPQ